MNADAAVRRNLLILSSGSKVAIARIAKTAAKQRGVELHLSDIARNVPTRLVADAFSLLPRPDHPDWEQRLLDLCEQGQIGLILPTRQNELKALARLRARLAAAGTQAILSDEATIDTCNDKLGTHKLLRQNALPTPETLSSSDAARASLFPAVAKPRFGSGSSGVVQVPDLQSAQGLPEDWVLQKKVYGEEYTVNLYIDSLGKLSCAVPHRRIAVESGEVVQAQTERRADLIELAAKLAAVLPGARGILNFQAFLEPKTGRIQIIEVNPRIGGGYPLCDQAKATYIEWLFQEYADNRKISAFANWTHGLMMMRYREGLFSIGSN